MISKIFSKSQLTGEQHRRMQTLILTLVISTLYAVTVLSLDIVLANEANTGYTTWLTPFDSFIGACVSFVALLGKGMLLWAFFETGTALYAHDVSQIPQGLRRIGAGCILVFVEPLLDSMVG